MLVLNRKADESLQIGRYVTITILRITGNRVKIGIEAPCDVHVRRTELKRKEDDDEPAERSAVVSNQS